MMGASLVLYASDAQNLSEFLGSLTSLRLDTGIEFENPLRIILGGNDTFVTVIWDDSVKEYKIDHRAGE